MSKKGNGRRRTTNGTKREADSPAPTVPTASPSGHISVEQRIDGLKRLIRDLEDRMATTEIAARAAVGGLEQLQREVTAISTKINRLWSGAPPAAPPSAYRPAPGTDT